MFLISYLVFLIFSLLITSILFRPKKGQYSFLLYLADDFLFFSFPRVKTRGYKYSAPRVLISSLLFPFFQLRMTLFLFTSAFCLSHLQSYDGQYGQNNSNNPKPGHNFWFRNSLFLKMMMDRTHQENTTTFAIFPLGIFKISYLNDH